MYPVFAVLLLALAGCTVLVVRRRGAAISEEALGFAVIGAAGLGLLAVAVLVVGRLSAVPGRAEGLALLGLGRLRGLPAGRVGGAAVDAPQGCAYPLRWRRIAKPAITAPAVAPSVPAPSAPTFTARRPVR